jgi:hypothetical protein
MKKAWWIAIVPGMVALAVMAFVLALLLVKVMWAWTVPDLFPGAVKLGLVARGRQLQAEACGTRNGEGGQDAELLPNTTALGMAFASEGADFGTDPSASVGMTRGDGRGIARSVSAAMRRRRTRLPKQQEGVEFARGH